MARKREQFSSYRQADVICPFWRGDNCRNKIRCEGIIGDTGTFYFRSQRLLDEHAEKFCCKDYASCPVCQQLEEKYDEDGRKK